MRIHTSIGIVVLAASSTGTVSAQARLASANRVPAAQHLPVSRNVVVSIAKDASPGTAAKPNLRLVSRPENAPANLLIYGLTVEQQRNAFILQTRVPLVTLFGGRLQLAGMIERTRGLNSHSAVLNPDPSASLRSSGAGTAAPRPGNSFGGGIWLRLDRPQA